MKQLSARRFRLTFPDITEPVLVITRTSEGYRNLGTWTPTLGMPVKAVAITVTSPVSIETDAEKVLPSSFFDRSFRPIPKPGAKKR